VSFWPESYGALLGAIAGTLSFVLLLLGYFKGWVKFRFDLNQKFKDLRDRINAVQEEAKKERARIEERLESLIGLPKNVSVKTAIDGVGLRVQAIVDEEEARERFRALKLGEFTEMQHAVRDLERETIHLTERAAEAKQVANDCLSENREAAREIQRQLTDIGKAIVELQVLVKRNGGSR
jgi:FtsZ-binding cell division protein ZapB